MPSPKWPKTTGECIDLCYDLREQRLEIEKQAKELKAKEDDLKLHIIEKLKKADLSAGRGDTTTASILTSVVPRVVDWDSFYDYIHREKAFDLLERRPGKTACRARWDEDESIPGVEKFPVEDLSLTKFSKK